MFLLQMLNALKLIKALTVSVSMTMMAYLFCRWSDSIEGINVTFLFSLEFHAIQDLV